MYHTFYYLIILCLAITILNDPNQIQPTTADIITTYYDTQGQPTAIHHRRLWSPTYFLVLINDSSYFIISNTHQLMSLQEYITVFNQIPDDQLWAVTQQVGPNPINSISDPALDSRSDSSSNSPPSTVSTPLSSPPSSPDSRPSSSPNRPPR